jgi:hypothetical protein
MSRSAQKAYILRKRDLSVTIWREIDPDTGTFRYTVSPGHCSPPDDAPSSETSDRLGFDDLLPAADELLRRANALPISAAGHDEPDRRDDDLRTMAWLFRRAHAVIAHQGQTDTRLRQRAARGEG